MPDQLYFLCGVQINPRKRFKSVVTLQRPTQWDEDGEPTQFESYQDTIDNPPPMTLSAERLAQVGVTTQAAPTPPPDPGPTQDQLRNRINPETEPPHQRWVFD